MQFLITANRFMEPVTIGVDSHGAEIVSVPNEGAGSKSDSDEHKKRPRRDSHARDARSRQDMIDRANTPDVKQCPNY